MPTHKNGTNIYTCWTTLHDVGPSLTDSLSMSFPGVYIKTLLQEPDDLRQDTVKLLQGSPEIDGPLESTVFARSAIIRLGVATRYE
ncbi:hypothetical protein HPB50_003876 [Hyalomma asiaticum]|uniref:Uncharacterized protein n=1 Tax=Hyalomma asiaticum TaxID=266040 RepID=A0ACB7RSH3_HYAAI|nr:hypothetical protein HPB50_003876 [Hyalomma asiaticum]